jgi:hypothetical protein
MAVPYGRRFSSFVVQLWPRAGSSCPRVAAKSKDRRRRADRVWLYPPRRGDDASLGDEASRATAMFGHSLRWSDVCPAPRDERPGGEGRVLHVAADLRLSLIAKPRSSVSQSTASNAEGNWLSPGPDLAPVR